MISAEQNVCHVISAIQMYVRFSYLQSKNRKDKQSRCLLAVWKIDAVEYLDMLNLRTNLILCQFF